MVKIAFAKRNLHAFFLQGAFAFGGFVVSAEFSWKIDLPTRQVAIVFFFGGGRLFLWVLWVVIMCPVEIAVRSGFRMVICVAIDWLLQ